MNMTKQTLHNIFIDISMTAQIYDEDLEIRANRNQPRMASKESIR